MATYVLEILDGDRAGETLPVADRTIRIGRKPGNDLVLADEKTSGVHAEVVLEGDRHVLRDLGSTNGTFLDGKRVNEIVLTPGDVVTIGRLRVKFRQEGAAVAADAGELAVRQLDASRVQRRGGSTALLGAVVLVGLGVGGYLWWQGSGGEGAGATGPLVKAPIAIDGNRLPAAIASCDAEQGWNLRAGGSGFQPSALRHTGSGGFEAVRGDGADAPTFAMLQLAEPVSVLAGRTMTLVAHVRCEGAAKVAVRAVCGSAGDAGPFRFRTGGAFVAPGDWQRVETVVAVPSGCDRLQLEIAAVLPAAGAVARIDDAGVVEGGQAAAIEQKLPESSQTVLGTGSAIAVRSVDPDNPATLVGLEPDRVPEELAGLHRAGLCALSDIGAAVALTATERSVKLEVQSASGVQFVFPADSASGLLIAGADGPYASAPAASEFRAARVVLGDRSTRILLHFDDAVTCRGQIAAGFYRLAVQAPRAELVLGFRAERNDAAELLRQAKSKLQEGRPGAALDALRKLTETLPLDFEVLAQAQALRAETVAGQVDALRRLEEDFDEAQFFDTRGGFDRVAQGVDELIALHGENNLEDLAGARALRDRAKERLRAIDGASMGAQRQRLDLLSKAFTEGNQPGLASLVAAYMQRALGGADAPPKDPASNGNPK